MATPKGFRPAVIDDILALMDEHNIAFICLTSVNGHTHGQIGYEEGSFGSFISTYGAQAVETDSAETMSVLFQQQGLGQHLDVSFQCVKAKVPKEDG